MALLVVIPQIIYILVDSVFDDPGFGVSFLFALLFADVAMVMLLSIMLVEVINVVEPLVEAKLTNQMVLLLMLVVLVPSIELLFEKQDGLMLNTKFTVVHMMCFV